MPDYSPVLDDARLRDDVSALVRLAIAEDLDVAIDWTTVCLVPADAVGRCDVVPRQAGVCAGLVTLPWIVDEFDADLHVTPHAHDGGRLIAGRSIATLRGNARDLLTAERVILNVLCKLCGIATLTSRYVAAIAGQRARLYDTRKTTPGWRRLEKYAVRMGGGHNHRSGLYDGFLIKDNHLGLAGSDGRLLPAGEAAARAMRWRGGQVQQLTAPGIVEIEVDSLEQLRDVLPVGPDIVLVDNFTIDQLCEAVRLRNTINPAVELEASGNVKIDTIAAIAATGVDRISSGALTHQATWLDLGLDWSAADVT